MNNDPKLFGINPESVEQTEIIEEVDFARLGFQERRDIQEWIVANPVILGEDLLIIGKEFSGFDRTNERLDLLAVDSDGMLVVIELKRDDTGADVHWQAIKYASYLHRSSSENIIKMTADYHNLSRDDAEIKLQQHLGADDLNALNNDQRIILASHRFAPEVTSAALWLNEKVSRGNLITCIQLIPYHDPKTNSLYVQVSCVIPVPGIENYIIRIGDNSREDNNRDSNDLGTKLKATFARNKNDEVTEFFRAIKTQAHKDLPDEIRPDKTSRWGAGWSEWRYYHFWYSREPWSNWGTYYEINLSPEEGTGKWQANVKFIYERDDLEKILREKKLVEPRYFTEEGYIVIPIGTETLNERFGNDIAMTLRSCIEKITPIVNDLDNEESVAGE